MKSLKGIGQPESRIIQIIWIIRITSVSSRDSSKLWFTADPIACGRILFVRSPQGMARDSWVMSLTVGDWSPPPPPSHVHLFGWKWGSILPIWPPLLAAKGLCTVSPLCPYHSGLVLKQLPVIKAYNEGSSYLSLKQIRAMAFPSSHGEHLPEWIFLCQVSKK